MESSGSNRPRGIAGLLTGPDFDFVINDQASSLYAQEVHQMSSRPLSRLQDSSRGGSPSPRFGTIPEGSGTAAAAAAAVGTDSVLITIGTRVDSDEAEGTAAGMTASNGAPAQSQQAFPAEAGSGDQPQGAQPGAQQPSADREDSSAELAAPAVTAAAAEPVSPPAANASTATTFAKPPQLLELAAQAAGTAPRSAAGSPGPGKHFGDVKELDVVQPGQLEALPFKPPTFPQHLVQIFLATIQVAQYIITMYMAIMVAQNERTRLERQPVQVSGLIKALVVMYPMVTMGMLTFLNAEMVLRKFMYYRLMSLQVLVDWDDSEMWRTYFFIYFCATWLLLNVWALWGCASLWPASAPWTTFIVVNAQTALMLIFYQRITTSEAGLVSVNDFIEHSPLFAKRLIDSMDVIREGTLRAECGRCLAEVGPRLRAWCRRRLCCGPKHDDTRSITFSLAYLREHSIRHPDTEGEQGSAGGSPSKAGVKAGMAAAGGSSGSGSPKPSLAAIRSKSKGLLKSVKNVHRVVLHHSYASVHFLLVCFQGKHELWPYPADLPYIRGLLLAEVLAMVAVVGVQAFSIYLAITNAQLGETAVSCSGCYTRLQGVATNCFPASGSCNALYDGYCTLGKLLNTSAALAGPWAGSLAKLAAGYCPAVDVQQVLNAGN